jgi:transcriptional regulator with GAF, ATPase, and Fis domain
MTYAQIRAGAQRAATEYEREKLEGVLKKWNYSVRFAARAIRCPVTTLVDAIKRHPSLKRLMKTNGPKRGRPRLKKNTA